MDYADRILELRKSHGLTQKQLADNAGLSEMALKSYEGRRRKPAHDALLALADYFHVSTDYLLGRTDNPKLHVFEEAAKENPIIDLMNREHLQYSDGVLFVQGSNFVRADLARKRLIDLITSFESTLPKDRQAALQFNVGGKAEFLTLKGIGYIIPDTLLFHADTPAGDSCLLVQHITQVNLLLVSAPRKDDVNSPRRKIGFVSMQGQSNEQAR